MAIGDAGAAKGLVVYPSTQAHSLGYQNDNQRADDIAAEIDARAAGDASERAARVAAFAALDSTDIPHHGSTVGADLDYAGGAIAGLDAHVVNLYAIMRAHGWSV